MDGRSDPRGMDPRMDRMYSSRRPHDNIPQSRISSCFSKPRDPRDTAYNRDHTTYDHPRDTRDMPYNRDYTRDSTYNRYTNARDSGPPTMVDTRDTTYNRYLRDSGFKSPATMVTPRVPPPGPSAPAPSDHGVPRLPPAAGASACYKCGGLGHLSYTCPLKGRSYHQRPSPAESSIPSVQQRPPAAEASIPSVQQRPSPASMPSVHHSSGLNTRLTDAEKQECRRLKKCYTSGHPYSRCPQEEKLKAQKESKPDSKRWRELCWYFKDGSGVSQGPFSLLNLYGKLQDGALGGDIEVTHLQSKDSAISLRKLMEYADKRTMPTFPDALPDAGLREQVLRVVQTKLHEEVLETLERIIFTEINEQLQHWLDTNKPNGSNAASVPSALKAFETEPPPPGCGGLSAPSTSALTTSAPIASATPSTSRSGSSFSKPNVFEALQVVQDSLHSGVMGAARKSILDVYVGEYLQEWMQGGERRKNDAKDKVLLENERMKALVEELRKSEAAQECEEGSDAAPESSEEIPSSSRKRKGVETPERRVKRRKETKSRKRLVKVASQEEAKNQNEEVKVQEDPQLSALTDSTEAGSQHENRVAENEEIGRKSPTEGVKRGSSKKERSVSFAESEDDKVNAQAEVSADGNKPSPRRPRRVNGKQLAEPDDDYEPAESLKSAKRAKKEVRGKGRALKTSEPAAVDVMKGASPALDSKGCSRCYISGWDWREWSRKAKVRQMQVQVHEESTVCSNIRSQRSSRLQYRGMSVLKGSQVKARKKRLKLQRSGIHAWGLVADERIEAEDFVIEYVGELIRSSVADLRERRYEQQGVDSSYLFRVDLETVVDATKIGGNARFINHSCDPNCYTKIVTVDGQKRIFIYAKKVIKPGEELTYDYKFPFEEKKIPCYCGAGRCRKYMN